MAISKQFLEAVSADAALKDEVKTVALNALAGFLKEKGLEDEAWSILESAVAKVAEAHGFKPGEQEELCLDELDSVAGGACGCVVGGGGGGTGKQCVCVFGGKGHNRNGKACFCPFVGGGTDV